MVDNEVVITYKRKRFSSRSDVIHGTKVLKSSSKSPTGISSRKSSPNIEHVTYDEKVNKDYSRCFKCGNVDVDENLLRCGCCSETHHFHCMDAPQKRKWQCPICHRRNDSKESQRYDDGESGRGRKNKRIEESEKGTVELLRPHKVFVRTRVSVGPSKKACCSVNSSLTKAADSTQMDCKDNDSRPSSEFTDLEDVKPDPIHLTPSTETKYNSRCPKDSVVALNSDKTNEGPKEKCTTPLITFSRRAKRKGEGTGKFASLNSKSKEKQCPPTTSGGLVAESRCNYENPSAVCILGDQPASAVVSLEQDEGAIVEKNAGFKSKTVGSFGKNKIATGGQEKLSFHTSHEGNISSQYQVPAPPATNVSCPTDKSNSFNEAAASDLVKYSKQSGPAKIGSPVRKESRNELATMSSELPQDVSPELGRPCELAFSIAPSASTCVSNVESNRPLIDAPENLLESQNSSTPSRPMASADEETDGRDKELEWLEDLDRVLQDKKTRNTSSFKEQDGVNCLHTSDGIASPMVVKSSIHITCDQGESPRYMNQILPLQGEVFLRKLGQTGCEKQHYDQILTRSSPCTNFVGMSVPMNHGSHVGSIKDAQSVLLPSSSGVKDHVHLPNRHLPWNPYSDNSFLQRHKQIVENGTSGTRISKERRYLMASMFGKYSNYWSEEELDLLWIGVRRHGVNNWNAMLRDPNLRFLESRTAEHLAMQWDIEQRKLLNGTLQLPVRYPRAEHSSLPIIDDRLLAGSTPANQYGYNAWSHAGSEFSMHGAETKLSLGDVYQQNRNFFQSSGICVVNPRKSEGSSTRSFLGGLPVGSMPHRADFRQRVPVKAQNTRYDLGASTSQQPGERVIQEQQRSGGLSETKTSNNLPHWLKEVLNNKDASKPRGSSLPPVASVSVHSEDVRHDLQPSAPRKDSRGRRGILKRKSVGSSNRMRGPRINEASSSSLNELGKASVLPVMDKTSPMPTLDVTVTPENNSVSNQNINSSGPAGPSTLVAIGGDASSEETISDNQD